MGKNNVGPGRPRKTRRRPNRLRAWMELHQATAAILADDLKISRSAVYALCDWRFVPGLNLAVAIERKTGIEVAYWAED